MKVWRCTICGYIHRGDTPPSRCPVCNAGAGKFEEIDEASIPEKQFKMKKTGGRPSQINPGQVRQDTGSERPAPEVSSLSQPHTEESVFEKIKALLIRHHLHPISVHTPNGILPVVVILWVVSWISGYEILSKAAFINLVFVIALLPFVIFTGFLEWQRKYKGALTLIFKIKIAAAALTCLLCIISFIWYIVEPDVLGSSNASIFIFINIIMLIAVGIAGHIGGKFVFKD